MKISDYVIRTKDRELVEFMDNVQVILNNGLYETRVVSGVPAWTGEPGESALYYIAAGTGIGDRRLYFYVNNVWCYIGWGSSGALSLVDADGDTGITPEYTADEDILRYYCAGNFLFAMGTAFGLGMAPNTAVVFDGATDGDSKIVYVSTSSYMTCYTDNKIRIEF